ncbi:YbhB/YbcL family Raf kinase inhibitor-like protein [Pontibacter ruber]|uniref:YbhB/YbcL family Raf kinase inhibitor-like protein n=1 Tax=Pontibacter ruber TaxID=1343895 RepID=A0ABW5CZL7_9BACT|nr:YbhB/YbcL family Raf kinase inhibitor-like protein [Pontibacter ruber]
METKSTVRLSVSSPAFREGEHIPSRYTCDGENINPALEVGRLPEGTQSLALIVDDPDAPGGTWTHWLVWDIDPATTLIREDSKPGTEGRNDFGNVQYGGPCPPGGTHRYYFKLYALDRKLGLREGSSRQDLLKAMEQHVLGSGELMGRYSRL